MKSYSAWMLYIYCTDLWLRVNIYVFLIYSEKTWWPTFSLLTGWVKKGEKAESLQCPPQRCSCLWISKHLRKAACMFRSSNTKRVQHIHRHVYWQNGPKLIISLPLLLLAVLRWLYSLRLHTKRKCEKKINKKNKKAKKNTQLKDTGLWFSNSVRIFERLAWPTAVPLKAFCLSICQARQDSLFPQQVGRCGRPPAKA